MTPLVFLVALTLGHVTAGVVELSCSDNATCIDHMFKEAARSLRQQKTVRLFDAITIEPLKQRQARSNDGPLARFTKSNAFSYDWNDYTFRVTRPQGKSDVLDLEIYQSRSAKDDSDPNPKKSSSKVEEDKETDKGSHKLGLRRRQKKKVLMAVIPLLFGMKSAAVVLFAMGIVTVLTLKAFIASKAALLVTVGMAVKKLYESYSSGVGLNHPYLYSQYPIDFPSASSHAYSVSGVSPQFASPELYNPTALASHTQAQELLQQQDASAQQSQQAPTIQLVNSTRAAERWDGKSKLLKLLEPVLDIVRSVVDPIASVFYSMPATVRGLNSEVSTTESKSYEPEAQESVTHAKIILVPQPRLIAQRKMNYRKPYRQRPKKYSELKINLDRLKHNKDLYDYIKTKKYKYNYPNTFYYPKVKYFVNPTNFISKPNNSRLRPYKTESMLPTVNSNALNTTIINASTEWKPIVVLSEHPVLSLNSSQKLVGKFFKNNGKKFKSKDKGRVKRSIPDLTHGSDFHNVVNVNNGQKRSIFGRKSGIMDIIEDFFSSDAMYSLVKQAQSYAKSVIKSSIKSKEPPKYYSIVYDILVWSLETFDGFLSVDEAVNEHAMSKNNDSKKPKPAKKQTVETKKMV